MEATTGWRFVVDELERIAAEAHLAEPAETSGWKGKKKRGNTDWADARHWGAVADRPAAGVVDPARAHPGVAGAGASPAYALLTVPTYRPGLRLQPQVDDLDDEVSEEKLPPTTPSCVSWPRRRRSSSRARSSPHPAVVALTLTPAFESTAVSNELIA